jgi:hypothetical protein
MILVMVVHCFGSLFLFFLGEGLSSNCIIELYGYTIFLYIEEGQVNEREGFVRFKFSQRVGGVCIVILQK